MRVGLSMRITFSSEYIEPRDSIAHDWISFLQNQNLTPILIPNGIDDVTTYLDRLELDFIILTGGDHYFCKSSQTDYRDQLILAPNITNQEDQIRFTRDVNEWKIIKYCVQKRRPLLGVCRGMQLLNTYFQGQVFSLGQPEKHVNFDHSIIGETGNFFNHPEQISMKVNSFHSQAIKRDEVGKSLQIMASSDNRKLVECFRHTQLPIIGMMWHPERFFQDKEIEILHQNSFLKMLSSFHKDFLCKP